MMPMFVLALVVGLAGGAMAAPKPEASAKPPGMIAVVVRADWCSACKANGPRVAKALGTAAADGSLAIVIDDVTDDETAKASGARMRAAGVVAAMAPYTATGVIYLFDAKTKHALRQVTVANTDEEIGTVIALARQQLSR